MRRAETQGGVIVAMVVCLGFVMGVAMRAAVPVSAIEGAHSNKPGQEKHPPVPGRVRTDRAQAGVYQSSGAVTTGSTMAEGRLASK